MKRIFILLSIASVIAACGDNAGSDKKAELEKLKKEHAEINDKIAKLEAELAKENPEANQKKKFVKIDTVKTSEFVHYVEVQGKVESDQNINILPKAMGTVTSVLAEVGDQVKKGQVLATIDDAIIRKSIDELNVRLEFATTLYNKQKNLWDQKIGTEVQFLQAKSNKEALEKALATAKEQLDMTLIKSTIDGVVDLADIKVGEIASNMKPAFRVVNFNKLKATGELAETYLNTVGTGDQVVVRFPDINKEISTTLNFAARTINPVSRTFKVEVKLDAKNEYRPNMLSVLKIVDYKAKNAVTVPMNIVQNDQSGTYVFTAVNENGKMVAKKNPITIGKIYSGSAEVVKGISAGDQIITLGYQDLNEGDLITK
jgi:RND family efflux transporter MFP subunit